MKTRALRLARVAAACLALLLMVFAGGLYTLQTKWFKDKVRREIVGAVEQATGGRVELGSFDYDWRTLRAEFRDFVIRGTEPNSAAPLLHADSVTVGLKIISVFKRNIDLASVVVRHPHFNLLVGPDGNTNIPIPPSGPTSLTVKVQALLNLKIRHFEFEEGTFQIGLRHIPLDVRGEDALLLLAYDRRGRRYDVKFSSRALHVNSNPLRPFSGALDASARLERDNLSIQNAVFHFHESTVETSGTLRHFAQPVIDLRLSANVDAGDIASITKFEDVGRGKFTLTGSGHYDDKTLFAFKGNMIGRDVSYRIQSVDFKKVSFESDVLLAPQDLELTHFVVAALGSRLSGQLVFKHGRDLQVDGDMTGLSVREAVALFSPANVPWSGVAAGPFHARAVVGRTWRDLTAQSNLAIVPGPGALPISGALNVTYRRDGNAVEFGSSYLGVPNTHLSFSGTLGANLDVVLDSTNLEDVNPVLGLLKSRTPSVPLPTLLQNGRAHFDGKVVGPMTDPRIAGNLVLEHFRTHDQTLDQLRSRLSLSANGVDFASLVLDQGSLHATAEGHLGLQNWTLGNDSAIQVRARVKGADVTKVASIFSSLKVPSIRGIASGTVDLQGTVINPRGSAEFGARLVSRAAALR